MKREVAKIVRAKSAKGRSKRLAQRTTRIRRVLNPSHVSPLPAYPGRKPRDMPLQRIVWSRPDGSGDKGSSDDWLLTHRVPVPSTDGSEEELEGMEEVYDGSLENSAVQSSESRSVSGDVPESEDEQELTSEEDNLTGPPTQPLPNPHTQPSYPTLPTNPTNPPS